MKRTVLIALGLLAAAYLAFGLWTRARRVPPAAAAPGELRGAFHVHTTRSDGRGTLDEVVRAAKAAGLDFIVVTDHNVLAPEDGGYRDGVLVVVGTEASTRYGHLVALGVPRALTREERDGDPLGAIRALGGEAVLAHPFHPRRPFTGWGTGPWRGFEVVSNDTSWHRVLADRAAGKVVTAALVLPWDAPHAVLDLGDDPSDELARFDAEDRAARAAGERRRPARVLLCSADAHGYPSYDAAFGAFSMHVPVARSGEAARDARAVTAALLDGSASCVIDAVAAASRVRLGRLPGGALELAFDAGAPDGAAEARLFRDGEAVPARIGAHAEAGRSTFTFRCEGACGPGDYRVEVRRGGRPWIFTNPVTIE
jgi:hypothetical protein